VGTRGAQDGALIIQFKMDNKIQFCPYWRNAKQATHRFSSRASAATI
jgi:hypothetical protein